MIYNLIKFSIKLRFWTLFLISPIREFYKNFVNQLRRVAVEPLYPQVCQKVPVLVPTTEDQGISPIDLSRTLNSVACSLNVKREDPVAIFHLIMEVRYTQHIFEQTVSTFSSFPTYIGSSLHEEFVELHTILAMLFGHTRLHTNIVSVFATTAAVLHRSDTLAVLLHHPCVVDIHDRYANRSDNNATRDREESVHSQWGGERRQWMCSIRLIPKCFLFESRALKSILKKECHSYSPIIQRVLKLLIFCSPSSVFRNKKNRI